MSIISKFLKKVSNKPSDEEMIETVKNWKQLLNLVGIIKEKNLEMAYNNLEQYGDKLSVNLEDEELELILFSHFINWWSNIVFYNERAIYIGLLAYTKGELISMERHAVVANVALENINKLKEEKWFTGLVLAHVLSPDTNDDLSRIQDFQFLEILAEGVEDIYSATGIQDIRDIYTSYVFNWRYKACSFYDIGEELAKAS